MLFPDFNQAELVNQLLRGIAMSDSPVSEEEALISSDDAPAAVSDTMLHRAARRGHTSVVNAILTRCGCVDQAKGNGVTSLYIACQQGQSAVVRLLIAAGANLGAQPHSALGTR